MAIGSRYQQHKKKTDAEGTKYQKKKKAQGKVNKGVAPKNDSRISKSKMTSKQAAALDEAMNPIMSRRTNK
jgi:hypothetical protein